jgi:hypothetical protein
MTMVLMEGFSNALERKIYATISSAKERIHAYREQIEQIMNHEVLGDDDGPAQWSVPMHDNGKTVGTITLVNNASALYSKNFERLIAISISDEIRRNKYNYCIPFIVMQYRLSGKIMISQMKISFNTRPLLTVGFRFGCNCIQMPDVPTAHICCHPDILLNICSSGGILIDSHSRDSKNSIMYFPHFTSGGLTMEVVDTGRQRNLS